MEFLRAHTCLSAFVFVADVWPAVLEVRKRPPRLLQNLLRLLRRPGGGQLPKAARVPDKNVRPVAVPGLRAIYVQEIKLVNLPCPHQAVLFLIVRYTCYQRQGRRNSASLLAGRPSGPSNVSVLGAKIPCAARPGSGCRGSVPGSRGLLCRAHSVVY